MSDATHTPEPWEIDFDDVRDGSVAIGHPSNNSDESWHAFARVVIEMDGKPSLEGQANADLIVAAPELLSALVDLIQAHTVRMGRKAVLLRILRAKDVIAKAEGRS